MLFGYAASIASLHACSIHVYDVCTAVRLHGGLNESQEEDNLQNVTATL